ncbi:MAG TPA: hypothetical protein VN282_08225 [Pyrinomonadaceae bacterium]|nr:hypothetical protein [Pyrinomonadaceae bacterium]
MIRRRLLCLGLFLCAAGGAPVAGQERVREVVVALPARLPLKAAVKNLERVADPENERWLRDLEVEVTNTGRKPVYFVSLLLHLPGAKLGGLPPVFKLRFGSPALGSFKAVARPEDVPLAPGESAVIKVPESEAFKWERWKSKGVATDPGKLVLQLHQLNFGDGTGHVGREGHRMPNPYAGYGRRR